MVSTITDPFIPSSANPVDVSTLGPLYTELALENPKTPAVIMNRFSSDRAAQGTRISETT